MAGCWCMQWLGALSMEILSLSGLCTWPLLPPWTDGASREVSLGSYTFVSDPLIHVRLAEMLDVLTDVLGHHNVLMDFDARGWRDTISVSADVMATPSPCCRLPHHDLSRLRLVLGPDGSLTGGFAWWMVYLVEWWWRVVVDAEVAAAAAAARAVLAGDDPKAVSRPSARTMVRGEAGVELAPPVVTVATEAAIEPPRPPTVSGGDLAPVIVDARPCLRARGGGRGSGFVQRYSCTADGVVLHTNLGVHIGLASPLPAASAPSLPPVSRQAPALLLPAALSSPRDGGGDGSDGSSGEFSSSGIVEHMRAANIVYPAQHAISFALADDVAAPMPRGLRWLRSAWRAVVEHSLHTIPYTGYHIAPRFAPGDGGD